MKYRDHRGNFFDSLETIMEVNSVEEIKAHINKSYHDFDKEVEEIKFEYSGPDEKTGWNTYFVLYRLKGEEKFYVAGMSDGKL